MLTLWSQGHHRWAFDRLCIVRTNLCSQHRFNKLDLKAATSEETVTTLRDNVIIKDNRKPN